MPNYDLDRASIHLPAEQYAKISEDMTFEELINTYGIPYNGYTSGFWTGRYITDKGETVTVYFGGSDKGIKIIGVILPKKKMGVLKNSLTSFLTPRRHLSRRLNTAVLP